MSIFKKITETVSKGVSTATEKAQQTVEITKLHTQIANKRKEIDKKQAAIGEAVFGAYLEKDLSKAEQSIIPICEAIVGIRREISALEDRIRELRNEKECECGQKVEFDTKFCPACGRKFEEPVHAAAEVVDASPEREQAALPLEEAREDEIEPADAEPAQEVLSVETEKRCARCGEPLAAEARFCPSCGNAAEPA